MSGVLGHSLVPPAAAAASDSFAVPRPAHAFATFAGQGKMPCDLEPRRIVEHVDAGAVQAATAATRLRRPSPLRSVAAAALEPVEATEHVPMLVRGSARPVVRDRDHGPAVMAIDRDGHLGGWSHPAPAGCWTVMRYCDGFEHACPTRVLSPTSSISMGRAIQPRDARES
jgi:hypothetical protein